jgi:hypothetical protein
MCLPSAVFPSGFPTKMLYNFIHFSPLPELYMSVPSNPRLCNTLMKDGRVTTMELPILHIYISSCYVLPVRFVMKANCLFVAWLAGDRLLLRDFDPHGIIFVYVYVVLLLW